jgi:regulator of ribonuclease activity A
MTPPTSDLADRYAEEVQVCRLQLLQYGGIRRFGGVIRTALIDRELVVLKSALDIDGNGSVLVADAGSRLDAALFGDHLAAIASARGWSGVIVNGALRDAETLCNIPLGIKALGTCPRRAALAGHIITGRDIVFGEVRFVPGHWIYCDDDGIIVSRRELKDSC